MICCNDGETLLHLDVRHRGHDTLTVIVAAKVNLNPLMCTNMSTPLTEALGVFGNDEEAALVLIEASANVNWKTRQGRSPLEIAMRSNFHRAVVVLQKRDAVLLPPPPVPIVLLHFQHPCSAQCGISEAGRFWE
jgi:ankyrin repeat protein